MSGWLEGFAHEPGLNAGYRAGRNSMEACTAHITAGACGGDRSVLLRGYANGYVPHEPGCGPGATQFAEVDAVTWHNCEWNRRCTGWEVEALTMGTDWTQYQLDIVGGVLMPQLRERGIEVAHTAVYVPHGPRIPVGAPVSGYIDHGALQEIACTEHHDGWVPFDELARIADGTPVPSPEGGVPQVEVVTVVADPNPYEAAGGGRLPVFPGAVILVDGAGSGVPMRANPKVLHKGMRHFPNKKAADDYLARAAYVGARPMRSTYNRKSFFDFYGFEVHEIDHRKVL